MGYIKEEDMIMFGTDLSISQVEQLYDILSEYFLTDLDTVITSNGVELV